MTESREAIDPIQAAAELCRSLEEVPPWERLPDRTSSWTPEQIAQRFPLWEFVRLAHSNDPPRPRADTWAAYGGGRLSVWCPHWGHPIGSSAPGSQGTLQHITQILLARPARVLPPPDVHELLLANFAATSYARREPEVIIRNEWAERVQAISGIRARIRILATAASRAVRRAGGRVERIAALEADAHLHNDTVDDAIAELRAAVPGHVLHHPGPVSSDAQPPPLLDHSMTSADDKLGSGGPARTLTAAGQVILAGRRPGSVLAAGDETTLKAAVARMPENEAKKARDYLAPSGKLVKGGWIERDDLRVIFTAKGAEAAMRRIRRDDERRRQT